MLGQENPYAELFWDALARAREEQASDIHIQPEGDGVVIRFRQDGEMLCWKQVGEVHKSAFLQEAKRLSQCSIGVSGRAQDSRISVPELSLDVRANLIPTIHGEKLVLRLLERSREFDLKATNLEADAIAGIHRALSHETGVCLITGPTGSGKTTLLYAALASLNRTGLNIVTIEDPVEYTFPGITQVQVSAKLSFADALRAMLRQDPDVVLVGEIRDRETADLCFQAAATGHLVLSTLHANSSREVGRRLEGLGIREDQIHDGLRFASAQRLVGRLCPDCRIRVSEFEWKRNLEGCAACRRGRLGRVPVFEYVEPLAGRQSPALRERLVRLCQEGVVDCEEVISAAS